LNSNPVPCTCTCSREIKIRRALSHHAVTHLHCSSKKKPEVGEGDCLPISRTCIPHGTRRLRGCRRSGHVPTRAAMRAVAMVGLPAAPPPVAAAAARHVVAAGCLLYAGATGRVRARHATQVLLRCGIVRRGTSTPRDAALLMLETVPLGPKNKRSRSNGIKAKLGTGYA
jgi:hypothetical protein